MLYKNDLRILAKEIIVFFLLILLKSNMLYGQTARKAPYLIYNGTNTEMQVLWQLDQSATCTIEWGTDLLYSLGNVQTSEYGDDHQHTYTISNLTPNAKYFYRVNIDQNLYTGFFRTAPSPNTSDIKFMVYGDSRTVPVIHDQVADDMVAKYEGDEGYLSLVIAVGDYTSNGEYEYYWDDEVFDPSFLNIQKMLATLPFQGCIGNHEESGVLFKKYFPYPYEAARYWSFDYGIAHFIIVDQYTDYSTGSDQLTWIENDLASKPNSWKFIILHEPGWSDGWSGNGNNVDVQDYIQPLCEQYNVPFIFAGHNHLYSRAVVNDVHHITTAGGGSPLYDVHPDPSFPYVVTSTSTYHYCTVEINGTNLSITYPSCEVHLSGMKSFC